MNFTHNVSLVVLRRPFGHMFKGIIPLIGWRLVTELLTLKLSSIPKTHGLLSPPIEKLYPQVTRFPHSKYKGYHQRKWKIGNVKVFVTTMMKNMSRAIVVVNKSSFISMSVPPPKWNKWVQRDLQWRKLIKNLCQYLT